MSFDDVESTVCTCQNRRMGTIIFKGRRCYTCIEKGRRCYNSFPNPQQIRIERKGGEIPQLQLLKMHSPFSG